MSVTEQIVARVLNVLERALKRDVRHPGACHLYVHTTELTSEPQRAEQCVEYLGNAVPGASHPSTVARSPSGSQEDSA